MKIICCIIGAHFCVIAGAMLGTDDAGFWVALLLGVLCIGGGMLAKTKI